MQAPLPGQIKEEEIFSAIDYRKDVDGFHPVNVGKLLLGQDPLFKPCTPAGVHELLIRTEVPLSGAEVVILGRGNIVGKPMAAILLQKVKPGAVVVDVGVNRVDDPSAKNGYRLVGDVDFEAVRQVAGAITPNPGGVGPMTIAMLLSNTVCAAELAAG